MLRAILIANDGSVARVVEVLLDTDMDMNDIYQNDKEESKDKVEAEEDVEVDDEDDDNDEMKIDDGTKEDIVKDNVKEVKEKKEEPKFQYPESLKQLMTLGFPDNQMLRA